MLLLFCVYLTTISSIDAVVEQNFYWRDYISGKIPYDAYEAAPGLYIGQVKTKEHIVANIYPNIGHAVAVDVDDVLTVEDDIKIFCSPDLSKFYWEYVDFDEPQDKQLQDAVKGVYHKNTPDSLYIGKVMHQDEWKIGKVRSYKHENNKGIWIWNQQQKPINLRQFHILKYNVTNAVAIEQDFCWRDYIHGVIPYNAIKGATGRYIGQVNIQGNFLPATIYPDRNVAIASYGGQRSIEKNIKIMCSSEPRRFYWERVDFNKQNDEYMKNAVKGGYQENLAINLFIGRIIHEDGYKIGKVAEIDNPAKGLYVWTQGGGTFRSLDFELLKYNSTN